jgi:hypothetical protein
MTVRKPHNTKETEEKEGKEERSKWGKKDKYATM